MTFCISWEETQCNRDEEYHEDEHEEELDDDFFAYIAQAKDHYFLSRRAQSEDQGNWAPTLIVGTQKSVKNKKPIKATHLPKSQSLINLVPKSHARFILVVALATTILHPPTLLLPHPRIHLLTKAPRLIQSQNLKLNFKSILEWMMWVNIGSQ